MNATMNIEILETQLIRLKASLKNVLFQVHTLESAYKILEAQNVNSDNVKGLIDALRNEYKIINEDYKKVEEDFLREYNLKKEADTL